MKAEQIDEVVAQLKKHGRVALSVAGKITPERSKEILNPYRFSLDPVIGLGGSKGGI